MQADYLSKLESKSTLSWFRNNIIHICVCAVCADMDVDVECILYIQFLCSATSIDIGLEFIFIHSTQCSEFSILNSELPCIAKKNVAQAKMYEANDNIFLLIVFFLLWCLAQYSRPILLESTHSAVLISVYNNHCHHLFSIQSICWCKYYCTGWAIPKVNCVRFFFFLNDVRRKIVFS